MAQNHIVSTDYRYVRIGVRVRASSFEGLALLDTGFEGDLVAPDGWVEPEAGVPDGEIPLQMADRSITYAPVYLGGLDLIGLGQAVGVAVGVLADEFIVGRGIIDRFAVTFDHGERVIVRL